MEFAFLSNSVAKVKNENTPSPKGSATDLIRYVILFGRNRIA